MALGILSLSGVRAAAAAVHYAKGRSTQQLYVRLGTSSEGAFEDILVDGASLRYTYNQRNSLEKPGTIFMEQRPYWTKADLVTETVALTPGEVADLTRAITQSKFLTLKSVYGTPKGRYYTTEIAASVNGRANKVQCRSGLHSGPWPAGFIAVSKKMVHLVNLKCKHKIAT